MNPGHRPYAQAPSQRPDPENTRDEVHCFSDLSRQRAARDAGWDCNFPRRDGLQHCNRSKAPLTVRKSGHCRTAARKKPDRFNPHRTSAVQRDDAPVSFWAASCLTRRAHVGPLLPSDPVRPQRQLPRCNGHSCSRIGWQVLGHFGHSRHSLSWRFQRPLPRKHIRSSSDLGRGGSRRRSRGVTSNASKVG